MRPGFGFAPIVRLTISAAWSGATRTGRMSSRTFSGGTRSIFEGETRVSSFHAAPGTRCSSERMLPREDSHRIKS